MSEPKEKQLARIVEVIRNSGGEWISLDEIQAAANIDELTKVAKTGLELLIRQEKIEHQRGGRRKLYRWVGDD